VATVRPDGSVERDTHVVSTTSLHDVSVDVTDCASLSDVRERVAAALAALDGIARVTLTGELAVAVDLRVADLLPPEPAMDAVIVRTGGVGVAYDFGAMASEPTVRGQFVKSVLESELSDEQRRRILVTGLRALDGRRDLEVV
jgi:hypothetical protein